MEDHPFVGMGIILCLNSRHSHPFLGNKINNEKFIWGAEKSFRLGHIGIEFSQILSK